MKNSCLLMPIPLCENTDMDRSMTQLTFIRVFSNEAELYVSQGDKTTKARILLMLVYGKTDEEREEAKSNAIKAFSGEAGLLVSLADIKLPEEIAKQVIDLQDDRLANRLSASELMRQNLLIMLIGDNVDQVIENFLPIGKDKFELREWSSSSETLLEYGTGLYDRFLDLSRLFI